jgi:hypothetical protein
MGQKESPKMLFLGNQFIFCLACCVPLLQNRGHFVSKCIPGTSQKKLGWYSLGILNREQFPCLFLRNSKRKSARQFKYEFLTPLTFCLFISIVWHAHTQKMDEK